MEERWSGETDRRASVARVLCQLSLYATNKSLTFPYNPILHRSYTLIPHPSSSQKPTASSSRAPLVASLLPSSDAPKLTRR